MAKPTTKQNNPVRQDAPRPAPTGNLPARQQQNGVAAAPPEAKQKPPIVQFREYVEMRMATLEDALPPTITPKRFVSVLMTALQNKPGLLTCTFPSLWNACVRAAQDGLLPDGREGAIAPYGENANGKRIAEIATWMPMIEGYRKKIFEAGHVKMWQVNVVYETDEFEYDLAENKVYRHQRRLGTKPPGGVVGAYSRAILANGEQVLEVMSAYEIMQVQAKSKASNGPWKDPSFFPEMCKKVVGRRHYKQLPHSESMDAMIARDDREHGLIDPDTTPPIAPPASRRLPAGQAFDAYAGDTIDHDTGEVLEDDRGPFSDQDRADFEQEASPASATGGASKEADAKSAPSGEAQASASTIAGSTQKIAEADRVIDNGTVVKDRDASTDQAAAASNNEPLQVDGDDRPWSPGTEPTTENEYGRYLDTKLASITVAGEVANWWKTPEEKALREKCGVGARFDEYQGRAMARRAELGKRQ